MKTLPSEVTFISKTSEFDETTIPKKLLKSHQTKEEVWGKIVILQGQLKYTINESKKEIIMLNENNPGVIQPTILHEVEPLGEVRFYVEFYRE